MESGRDRPEITVEPTAHLAILPGTLHISPIYQVEWLASMTNAFLDAPMPENGHRRFTPDRGGTA